MLIDFLGFRKQTGAKIFCRKFTEKNIGFTEKSNDLSRKSSILTRKDIIYRENVVFNEKIDDLLRLSMI